MNDGGPARRADEFDPDLVEETLDRMDQFARRLEEQTNPVHQTVPNVGR